MTVATVGGRYQVVIPRRERERLGLKPHSKVVVEAREDGLMLYPQTVKEWRGIGRKIADGEDATDYVRKLRREWEWRA